MMRNWLFILSVINVFCGCKTAAPADSAFLKDEEVAIDDFLSIKDFNYAVDQTALSEVARRLGCDQAADWISMPRNGDLARTVQSAATAAAPYEYLERELFAKAHVKAACDRLQLGARATKLDGIKTLIKLAKDHNQGLTIMMNGGFGSHLTSDGAFIDSRTLWAEELNGGSMESEDLRIVRHECLPNSYDTDDACAPKLVARFEALEASLPAGVSHRYLLLGYSKGGNSSLQAISLSQDFRDKVLAVITFGSPIGGGIATNGFYPLIAAIGDQYQSLPEDQREAIGYLLQMGAGTFVDPNDPAIKPKLDLLLAPGALALLKRGFSSLLPTQRKRFLQEQVSRWDYGKSQVDAITGKDGVSIFHVAAISDLGKFRPLPQLTTDSNGKIVPKKDSMISAHLTELVFLNEFRNHPLNDTCVALEHAVLHHEYLPQKADVSLLALLKLDHFNIGLSPVGTPSPLNVPGEEILDGILHAAATKLSQR